MNEPLPEFDTPLTGRPTTRRPPPLSDKLRRAVWQLVCLVLFRPSPVPLHGWRRGILRLFGAKVGARVAVYPGASIYAPWNLELGDGTTIGGGTRIYSVDRIILGPRAVVSQGAHLCTATHDLRSPGFELTAAPIRIGADAWVAADAFVGPGVEIGNGSVVAARGVVVRSVGAWQIVAGNPARPVGERPVTARNSLPGRV